MHRAEHIPAMHDIFQTLRKVCSIHPRNRQSFATYLHLRRGVRVPIRVRDRVKDSAPYLCRSYRLLFLSFRFLCVQNRDCLLRIPCLRYRRILCSQHPMKHKAQKGNYSIPEHPLLHSLHRTYRCSTDIPKTEVQCPLQ